MPRPKSPAPDTGRTRIAAGTEARAGAGAETQRPHGIRTLTAMLYPLWMLAATGIGRAGGMIILLLVGRGFAPDRLADYFTALATIGIAISIAQAGTGPLLIRLWQGRNRPTMPRLILAVIGLRLVMAALASVLIAHWSNDLAPGTPAAILFVMPFAAALAPDWISAANGQLSRLAMIALAAQIAGVLIAFCAVLSGRDWLLFSIAPAISVTGCVASLLAAIWPPAISLATSPAPSPIPAKPDQPVTWRWAVNLAGFAILAGILPNLDFVVLARHIPAPQGDLLFMAQRVFLLVAAIITALSAALFARQQAGIWRDIWLLCPAMLITILIVLMPDGIARLFFATPPDGLGRLLQIGALWPILLALASRQILRLQERGSAFLPGWVLLILFAGSSLVLRSIPDQADGTLILIQIRLAILLLGMAVFIRPQPQGITGTTSTTGITGITGIAGHHGFTLSADIGQNRLIAGRFGPAGDGPSQHRAITFGPFGFECSDRHSFVSLTDPCRHARPDGDDWQLDEGRWRLSYQTWPVGDDAIRIRARLYALDDGMLQDMVIRLIFDRQGIAAGQIAGKTYPHTNSDKYRLHAVSSVGLSGQNGETVTVTLDAHDGQGRFAPWMYLRDCDDHWIIHARLLPHGRVDRVWLRWANRFFTLSAPDWLTRVIWHMPGGRACLWRLRERLGRHAPEIQAVPMNRLRAGQSLMLEVTCTFS